MDRKHILIVDDEVLISDHIADFLERKGFMATKASSGEKAIHILDKGFLPDLILMDIDLGPGRMDGTETTARINQQYDIPVVFHSCHSDDATINKTKAVSKHGIINKVPGNEIFLLATIDTALSLHETTRQLKESEERYRTLAEAAHDMIFIINRQERVEYVNQFAIRQFGRSMNKILGKSIGEIFPAETFAHQHSAIQSVFKTGIPVYRENEIQFPNVRIWLGTWLVPLRNKSKQPRTVLGIARDISERKKAEMALRESEERFRNLFENSTIGIYRTTPDGRILLANPALVRMLGYSTFKDLALRNLEESGFEPGYIRSQFKKRIEAEGKVIGLESAWKRRDGSVIYVRESAKAVREADGQVAYYEGTVEDITEKKRAEERIQKTLSEKEMLLTELQHRVKNNMAVISSLLSLEMRNLKDPEAVRIFNESRNRIESMSRIYDKLTHSENLRMIDFRDYIRDLVGNLFRSYNIHLHTIRLELNIADVHIDLHKAIPCGLILNELISNTLKYAFPDGRSGNLSVYMKMKTSKTVELIVKDDGVGFVKPFNRETLKTLGLHIVWKMVEQLEGRIRLTTSGQGSQFRIGFPV